MIAESLSVKWQDNAATAWNTRMNAFLIVYLNIIIWAPVLHYNAPLTVLGFSIWNTVLPTIGLFGMFSLMIPRFSRQELELSLGLIVFFVFFYFVQKYFGITSDNVLKYYVNNRFIFNIFFLILIFNHIDFTKHRNYFLISLLFSFLFANITSILYLMGLPTFRIYDPDLSIYEIGRFGGIWGAPNGFAYLIALVCFAMITLWRIPTWLKLSLYTLSVMGWVMAGSRLCALFYMLLLPLVFMDISKTRKAVINYILLMVAGAVVIIILLFTTQLGQYLLSLGGAFNRMMEQQAGEDIRVEKNAYFLGKLFESVQNFFLGIPSSEQISNVVTFSDNGLLLFMLNLGIPNFISFGILILYLTFQKIIIWSYRYIAFWILVIIIGITFFVNNATIWDNYIFVSILILYLLAEFLRKNQLERAKQSLT